MCNILSVFFLLFWESILIMRIINTCEVQLFLYRKTYKLLIDLNILYFH